MTFDEVVEKFLFLFEEGGAEQDCDLVNKHLDTVTMREESASICLDYLKENIPRMAPVTLLTNVGLLYIGKKNDAINYEYPITQFEFDYLTALVLKYGEMRYVNNANSGPQEIEMLLKAIRIYIFCVEHELHKEDLNAFTINTWYRTGRIEGFDRDKLALIELFCKNFDTATRGSELVNAISLLQMYDKAIGNRLNQISGKEICLEQQYNFFMFSEADIRKICWNNNIDYRKIMNIINLFVCEVGDFKEVAEEQIYLKNPITSKFIIKLWKDHYFIPNGSVISENIFELLKLIVADTGKDLAVYSKCKSKFLEQATHDLLLSKFGAHGSLYINSEWDYNGRHGENDCLLVYENVALIFEDKSGEVNRNTTKGIMKGAYKDSEKLVYDPTEQAVLFSKLIEDNFGNTLRLKIKGGGENSIDLKNVNKTICVGVIFEETILQNIVLKEQRHIPIISIFQLNKILKCLEKEEFVDYLIKRTKIEENVFYHATEYDFLYTYLVNGLNTSNKIYEKMSENEKLIFHYKEGEITRDDLHREVWFQKLLDYCMMQEGNHRLEKIISLLEIPPLVQTQIWRDIKQNRKMKLRDNLAARKKIIVITLLDYFDSDTYDEIIEDLHCYEEFGKNDESIENILYIAMSQGLEKCVIELSVKGQRLV